VAVAPGSSRIIYVVSDISSGLAIGNLGHVDFRAHTRTLGVVGSLPGSSHPNITVIGQTSTGLAITGLTGGQGSARGSYIIDGVVVTVKKTIISPTDANSLIPGIEMRYRLLVEVQGIGSVQNLVVNDPIPAQLTYVANSITLDGGPRTDAVNTDNAQFSNNNVSVNLGNVTAPASYVVEFRAILK
jgi:uncharacterized repeat protein (TIGR01451 family)